MSDAQPATPSAESKDIVTTITTTTMPEVEETSSSENTSKKFQAEMLEVAFTEEEIEEMKKQIAHQDEKKMGQYWIEKLEKEAARNWNKFYKNNTTNFFKDRHYLGQEMPELLQACEAAEKEGKPPIVWMEVGSGVGNAVLPLLETVKNLHVQTMDCSRNAVELLKKHPSFEPERCVAHVCDIALEEFPFAAESADFASLVFVLSALAPEAMPGVLRKIYKCLKPGGMLYLRDYAAYDMAMTRFAKGSKIAERFYVRGDGTRAYFFEREELLSMVAAAGFTDDASAFYVRRVLENRKESLSMKRTWIQLKCYKPRITATSNDETSDTNSTTVTSSTPSAELSEAPTSSSTSPSSSATSPSNEPDTLPKS